MRRRVHTISRWLVAISLVLTSVLGYLNNQLFDEDAFAGLISQSVDRVEVRRLLATKAVDVAIEASDADVLLADVLPEDLSLVATPALELSKPAIAEAGATLLGVDAVESGLDAAARSIHRQTSSTIASDEPADVVVDVLPLLVVVADEIAGDVGARAAVGLDLPDSATSINLGSNQNAAWTIARSLGYLAAAATLLWLAALAAYFVTAAQGGRLLAARRLGRTFAASGVAVLAAGWVMLIAAATLIEIAFSSDDAISFGGLSVGGMPDGGGIALAEAVFNPLLSTGRRMIITGLLIIAATFLLGRGLVARGLRASIRTQDPAPLFTAVRHELPAHVRRAQQAIAIGLAVLLMLWPQITLRIALTLTALAAVSLLALVVATGTRAPWTHAQTLAGFEPVEATDATERSLLAQARRRVLAVVGVVVALVWPSYDVSGFVSLSFFGAVALAWTYRWELKPTQEALATAEAADLDDEGWSVRRKLVVGAVVGAGVLAVAFGGENTTPASATGFAAGAPTECNGLATLCDRRLDDVVFAGTHNSMSSSDLGWELANHEGAIPAQLDGGIRALLIDVQYWPEGESLSSLELDPRAEEIAAAALDVSVPPEDGLWMCHNLCQLGGTPFADFLADLRAFLETNPDEVLIVVIQDDAPATDIKDAIVAAEVDSYAFAHEPDSPWPTLAEMIETNERVVFLAENVADDEGWYQRAFDGNVSDTGFRYGVLEDFECGLNRGGDDGAFLMINHWVETGLPIPSEADAVNSRLVLRDRVDDCVAERGRGPGIIAVNFWERGDLLAFVDELNA